MKKRILLSVMALGLVFAQALMAQTPGTPATYRSWIPQVDILQGPTSYLNQHTFGVLKADVDNAVDVNDYSQVQFNSFLITAGASTDREDMLHSGYSKGPGVAAGFAKYFGSFYIGLFYDGVSLKGENSSTEYDGYTTDTPVDITYENIGFYNSFAIMVGNEIFGAFRVDLDVDIISYEELTENLTSTQTDNYRAGSFGWALTWGKNFALGSGILKPELTFGMVFALDQVENDYEDKVTPANSNSYVNGRTAPDVVSLRIAAEYDLAADGDTQSTIFGGYLLKKELAYENETNNPPNNWATETVSGKTDNTIWGGFKQVIEVADGLKIGYLFGANIGINFEAAKSNLAGPPPCSTNT